MKIHVVNIIYALILIATGLAAYWINESRPPTALITPFIGLLLLGCSKLIKRENRFVTDIVAVITLILSLMTGRLFSASLFADPEMIATMGQEVVTRRAIIFGIIAFSGFIATGFYVLHIFHRRRKKQFMDGDREG